METKPSDRDSDSSVLFRYSIVFSGIYSALSEGPGFKSVKNRKAMPAARRGSIPVDTKAATELTEHFRSILGVSANPVEEAGSRHPGTEATALADCGSYDLPEPSG